MMDIDAEALDLTLDEIESIEDMVDAPSATWGDIKQGRLLKAIVCTIRRRTDPSVTLEDVGSLKVSDLDAELRPTTAGE